MRSQYTPQAGYFDTLVERGRKAVAANLWVALGLLK
jgi:hypothetical protein